jgi:hypothetical protein
MLITAGSFRPGRSGPALGWGISLLVHALLAAMLVHAVAHRPDDSPPAKRIDFILVPPRAVAPAPTPAPAPVPAAAPRPRAKGGPAIVVPVPVADPAASPDGATPAATPAPEPEPAEEAPAFDMAAARGIARKAAREGPQGLVALPKRPPPTLDPGREMREEQLARDIARSRRNDCRSAYSGMGLLAVLPLLKDAVTGSGCKW